MRELAHQELGMLSPRLQLRCGGAHVGDQRVGFDKRRRRVATLLPLPSVRSATVAESRERHEPKMRTRVPRPASVQRELEARKASASPTAIQLIGTCRRTVRPCALTTVYYSLTVTSALGQTRRFRDVRLRSGPPPTADISRPGRHFAFGPEADMSAASSPRRRPRRWRQGGATTQLDADRVKSSTPIHASLG
jgi:hypothetical protein